MFIKLKTSDDSTDVYVAVDQISSFRVYSRYQDSKSVVTMRNGDNFHVAVSTERIAELIATARSYANG